MKVRILKTDERLGIKAGEIYKAYRYRYDPEKVVLDSRVPDGYDPMCTQYLGCVEIVRDSTPGGSHE